MGEVPEYAKIKLYTADDISEHFIQMFKNLRNLTKIALENAYLTPFTSC